MKKTKNSLLHSVIALLLCISMLIGTTFAWFSDKITSGKNIITAGNLDLEMYWTNDLESGEWHNVEEDGHNTIFSYDNWEPGYTDVKYIKLVNAGKLALNYKLSLTPENGVGKLAEVINVYYAEGGVELKDRSDLQKMRAIGLLDNILNGGATADGTLLAGDQYSPLHPSGEVIMTVALNMLTTAGNEYQNEDSGKFTITALATQAPFEEDSFGKDYDANAEYPTMLKGDSAVAPVTPVDGKVPAGGVTLSGSNISAFVPEGTEMEAGANKLTLKVTPLKKTTSDIIVVNNEILIPVDVHIDGVAESNTVPIIVNLGEILPKYLNMGNYHLYHVENGTNSVMQLVADASALTAHNTFTYDPLTGAVSVAMASFSEVTAVADTAAKWEGKRDYSWYKVRTSEYTIANADQFAALSAIVGGMDGQTQDSFSGKTIKLLSDINLNHGTVLPDEENATATIFYPVGYYNSEGTYERTNTAITSGIRNFEGTFDGNGHTISNIYQNTWEMKGDHDWYAPEDQCYRDGMGLFGKVYGGTIKNITVDNFKSDGEITTTGVIASYADFGATFENIAITNCNPRVYNIGNGGIVGCVGWYTKDVTDKVVTFKNITIDNSNMISALWGSYDVACGGIVGQYYPISGQTSAGTPKNPGIHFENCHVAAIMDVYNDVCANYQYYAYRYAGILMGSVRENETIDGHVYPKMDGITAEGCTVHFGTWNDYYYCEYEKNGHPSYSGPDDYKFSRIPHSELNFTDSDQNGKINSETERESVKGCKHNHTVAEDNQAVYLPFKNLVTGYGWGVTSKAVGEMEGVTILDREEGNSYMKFAKANTAKDSYARGTTVTIGELFKAADIADRKLPIKSSTVQVTVSPVGEGSAAGGTYVVNAEDWTKGTLKFTGTGDAEVIITDYYFCKETNISVTISDSDFLYRVGNQSAVTKEQLSLLLTSKESNNVEVVEYLTKKGTNWTVDENKIKFEATGVVKLKIDGKSYFLEVVDAKNITTATSSNGTSVVLLQDVKVSSNGNANYTNCTVYGNGFTFDVCGGMNQYNSKQGHGIIICNNSTLDNLVIVGDVYDEYGMYSKTLSGDLQNDYTGAVDATNSTIRNCYIANCATPIRSNGNKIVNTTLYGGTIANLLISGGTNVLTNVTTVNHNDGRVVIGAGIVITDGAAPESTKLILNGYLKQYNYVYETDVSSIKLDDARTIFNSMFESQFKQYHIGSNPKAVNTGIISVNEDIALDENVLVDNAKTGYVCNNNVTLKISAQGMSKSVVAAVATVPSSGTVNNDYDEKTDPHKATVQGNYLPTFAFDLGDQKLAKDNDDDTRYLIGDKSGIESLHLSNESPNTLDLTKKFATIYKYDGVECDYSVCYKDLNGNIIGRDTKVSLNQTGILEFNVTDNNCYDKDGNKLDKTEAVIFEVPITVSVKKATIKNAEIEITKSNIAGDYNSSKYMTFNPLEAISVTDYDADGTGTTVVLSENISSRTVEYNNSSSGAWGGATITLTYADGRVLTIYLGSSTLNSPGASNGGKTITIQNDGSIKTDGKVASSSATGGTWTINGYSFKGNNGTTVNNDTDVTVTFEDESGCFTPDTLITLADGSQKRVDELNANDKILAWDFFTGTYVEKEISLLVNHGEALYKVANLKFSDNSMLRIIAEHGIFDYDLNKFVYITVDNMNEYIGHRFVKYAADGNYNLVTLVDAYETEEYTSAWSVSSAETSNAFASGLLTVAPPEDFYNWIEMDEKLHYDVEQFQKDIATYGLYTYEDFKDYVTYEQFVEWNGAYLKVAVEKGHFTFEYILELIEMYKGWMP